MEPQEFIRITNWAKFQHYKDRNPPWIKLHQSILTSREWVLSDDSKRIMLIAMMLLAARDDNKIPNDPLYIKAVARLDSEPDLAWLIKIGFCEYWTDDKEWKSPWPSRHVSPELRAAVLERDGHKCLHCGSAERLEVDHIIPVSKGGVSQLDNLQTLCVSCNRRKRTNVAKATRCVADATLVPQLAYSEAEAETERETETKKPRAQTRSARNRFDEMMEQKRKIEAQGKRLLQEQEVAVELNVGGGPQ
jgi:hypothetical protein